MKEEKHADEFLFSLFNFLPSFFPSFLSRPCLLCSIDEEACTRTRIAMLRQLRTGGGLASSAAAAAAAAQALRESQSSLAAAAAACGNLRLLRHLSADASPSSSNSSSGGSSSSSVAEDPRWKSPLFDALLSLAARVSSPTSTTPPLTSTIVDLNPFSFSPSPAAAPLRRRRAARSLRLPPRRRPHGPGPRPRPLHSLQRRGFF